VSFRVLSSALLVGLVLPCVAACNANPGDAMPTDDSDAAADAAADASVEGPVGDPSYCTGEPPVMKARIAATNEVIDPDWSCYDVDPMPSGPMPVTFRLEPAQIAPLLGGLTVDFFFAPTTLGMPAITRVVDPGVDALMFEIPAGVETVSARIHPSANDNPMLSIPEFREYGLWAPPTDASIIQGYVALQASLDLIVSFVVDPGQRADPARSMIIALARDCSGREVSGGLFDLIDGETDLPVPTGRAPGEPRVNYFQYALPSTSGCTFTSNDQAAWTMVDAPTNVAGDSITHPYRLRLSGRMRATDTTPVVMGEREIELSAGTFTFVRLYR